MNPSKSRNPRFWHRWANAGAVNFTKLDMEAWAGSEITRTIAKAIETAKNADQSFANNASVQLASLLSGKPVPMFLVSFDFNGVKVSVCQDSDPKLIYRDWSRTLSGYTSGKKVGPYPKAELSAKEVANDGRIQAEKEARWAKESAKAKVVQDQKEREFFAELNTCPAMDRDEAKWQEGIEAQKGQGYGLAVYTYAEYWARLMQKKMAEGYKLEAIADECSNKADIPCGITGFMYGCAVSSLANCWKHGEELRVWHNKKYQLKDEGDKANASGGVLNPALLCVG